MITTVAAMASLCKKRLNDPALRRLRAEVAVIGARLLELRKEHKALIGEFYLTDEFNAANDRILAIETTLAEQFVADIMYSSPGA